MQKTEFSFASFFLLTAIVFPTALCAQSIKSELITQGLQSPVDLAAAPGDPQRLFAVELQSGLVRLIKDGQLESTPFLDLSSKIDNFGTTNGLRGIAFHPNYAVNGTFYVSYTRINDVALVVERYRVNPTNPDRADPSSGEEILVPSPSPQGIHNAGCLQFDPNGFLYVSIGDGGRGCQAQNFNNLLGKIIPLDVADDTPLAALGVFLTQAIPAPSLAGAGIAPTGGGSALVAPTRALPSNYHIGFRNPWRFSFDRDTGDLYVGDVGEADREEISYHPAGSPGIINHGWPMMEGNICGPRDDCFNTAPCNSPALKGPIHDYEHGPLGRAVIGGYVYRGKVISGLQGTYFYGDNQGKIYSFRNLLGTVTEFTDRTGELGPISNLTAFGEDADGELYFLSLNGRLSKIVPDP